METINSERAYDASFKTPFRMILAGPSGSGKTTWVYNFLKECDKIMDVNPAKIIIYYSLWQPLYDEMNELGKNISFRKKMPSAEDIEGLATYASIGGTLVIIDDQALSVNRDTAKIFTGVSRHSKVSIIFLTQNFFMKNVFSRDVSLQATYIVLFKNPRDQTTMKHLAQQILPNNKKFVSLAHEHAVKTPYSYFLIDLHQQTNDAIRFRTNVLSLIHI